MTVKVVKLNDFAKVLKENSSKHISEVKAATYRALAQAIPILVENSPVDTGLYAASWTFTMEEESAFIGNFAPHAAIIEEGARPFTPPIAPLLAWAKRVLKDPSQPPEYSDRVWALASYTRNKIQEHGMMPRHILQNALPAIIEAIRRELLA